MPAPPLPPDPCAGTIELPGLRFALGQSVIRLESYDTLDWEEKLSRHSWLVDLGVMLSEPAIRFDGMAGECLWGCACWVVVPYDEIRGPATAAASVAAE